jgi:adenylate cyclase
LFTAFISTVVFTTLLSAGISALHVRNLVKDSIRDKLYTAVGIGAKQISGDEHALIRQPGDENSAAYGKIFLQLNEIRKVNADIKNVYTIRRTDDGGAIFIVDSDPKTKERAEIGHKVLLITPSIEKAFANPGSIQVEDRYFTDEWGTFVSGFAPIYTSNGKFEALLGMDVLERTVRTHQLNNILAIILASLVVTFMSVFLSLIIAREISNPVSSVTADMLKIKNFNLDTTADSSSMIHEIREMTDALESMKIGLRSFKKYVPTELVSDLIKLKKEATLEVENRHITILFTDIKNFTTISEKISPHELAESIGLYFARMTQAIMDTGGIVDKFIGDAIMDLWGAPHDLPEHAIAACKAALACRKIETEINALLKEKNLPTFFTRMGINTGDALVGNIGFDRRMSYTAIGDSVNLASRLEGVNKFYETGIIISQNTYQQVSQAMLARFIDVVIVKGKTSGVRIYELVSSIEEAQPEVIDYVGKYNEAMELYIERQWSKALELFSSLKGNETDRTLAMMLDRCQKFSAEPPDDDFVGIVSLRNK